MTTIEDFNRMLTEGNKVTVTHDDRVRGGVNEQMVHSVREWHRYNGSPTNQQILIHKSKIKTKL